MLTINLFLLNKNHALLCYQHNNIKYLYHKSDMILRRIGKDKI